MNAKSELLGMLQTYSSTIRCASIQVNQGYLNPNKVITLKLNHTPEELQAFFAALDFEYDNGYGGQNLFGTVWLTNNTWLERGEYDGSEWWNFMQEPEVPAELQ